MFVRSRYAWFAITALICLTVAGPACGLTKQQARALNCCRAMYHGSDYRFEPQLRQQLLHNQHAAKRYFDSKNAAELRRELVPIRRSLHRSSFSFSSVAFVLAYYGVDVVANAERVLSGFGSHFRRLIPSTEQSQSSLEYDAYLIPAIEKIYKRHPSDKLWSLAFQAYAGSGTADEGPPAYLAAAFMKYPGAVLRAISHPPFRDEFRYGLHDLVVDLEQYSYDPTEATSVEHPKYTRVRALLAKLVHSKDSRVAVPARKLRKLFLDQVHDK